MNQGTELKLTGRDSSTRLTNCADSINDASKNVSEHAPHADS